VQDFTSRGLSVPSDRLLALAGAAARYSNAVTGRYLEGLWERALGWDLLWSVVAGSDGAVTPSLVNRSSRRVSWSWASVGGEVTWEALSSGAMVSYDAF